MLRARRSQQVAPPYQLWMMCRADTKGNRGTSVLLALMVWPFTMIHTLSRRLFLLLNRGDTDTSVMHGTSCISYPLPL